MTLEEIKAFLEENKDNEGVKAYLDGLKQPTKEDVEGYLNTDDGKKLLQPRLDKNFSKGLETWKENNLETLIDDEVKKRHPEKTSEQLEIEKLKQQFEESERKSLRKDLKNKALTVATEKNIPSSIIDHFIGEDEDATLKNLDKFQESMKTYVQKQVDERLKDNDYKPPKGNGDDVGITVEDFNKMTYTEKVKLKQEEPNIYDEMLGKQ